MLKFVRAAAFAGATLLMAHGAYADTVIKSVMHSPLRLTDPHATTAYITTWHGYMIYDTLLATDADNKIQPQMLEKWDVSPDGKTYTMTLRDGQKWHDGKPVTADDCVASIKRWASGDIMGRTLLKFTDKIEIVDDKTFRVVMKEPTDLVLRALSAHRHRALHDAQAHRRAGHRPAHHRHDRLGSVQDRRVRRA